MPPAALLLSLVLLALAAVPAQSRTPVQLGTAVNNDGFQSPDARYKSTLAQYDAAVGESAFKIQELEPQQGTFSFGLQDQMVTWSAAHGQQFHGSTLVWCDDQWLPGWLLNRSWTPDELRTVMGDFITTVMQHFGTGVQSWDVVNEAFDADGTLRDCLWSRVLGASYIEDAFRFARAAVPTAKLFYNEYKAEWVNSKFNAMEDMARDFLARDVPLDGIGLQMHLFGRAPPQYRLEEAMQRLAALGLTVEVSELDGTTSLFSGTTAQKLDQQAQAYQTVAAACQAQPACTRLTTWGFTDAYSWRGAAEMALPFNVDYQPKPAWTALQRVLRTPAPAPGNHLPGAPGAPAASAAVNRGQHTITWPAATDADGESLTYTLQHRDANDVGWTTIGSGMRSRSYTFSSTWPEPQGTWTYRVIASDAATDGAPSASSAPVIVDRAAPRAPLVAGDRAPEFAPGAWFADAVTLGFTSAGDPPLLDGSPGSGVDPATVPPAQGFTTAGLHVVTGTVTDLAGNVSAGGSGTAQVDTGVPGAAISASAGGVPYVAGAWTNQPVTVHLACTDDGSGVGSADPDAVVATDGAAQQHTAACRDRVGHTATATFGPIAIDRTPPVAPSPTVAAVMGRAVTLSAGVTDAPGGSGVPAGAIVWSIPGSAAKTGPTATYTFKKTGAQLITLRFQDGAGNSGSAVITVVVGKVARPASVTRVAQTGDVVATIPREVRLAGSGRLVRLRLTATAARTVRVSLHGRNRARALSALRIAVPRRATRTGVLRLPASARPGAYLVRMTVFTGPRRIGRTVSAPVSVVP